MGVPIAAAPALKVNDEQRAELVRLSRSTSLPHRVVVQAQGLLLAADGIANEEIGRRGLPGPSQGCFG